MRQEEQGRGVQEQQEEQQGEPGRVEEGFQRLGVGEGEVVREVEIFPQELL